jgi:hypothetical protein
VSGEKKKDYEVGYKKPPIATRFQKGRSGNPNGRPKKIAQEFDPGKILQSIDNEEIVVQIDGKRMGMPKAEIFFRQFFTKAVRGDLTAARLISKMATEYFGPEAEGPSETKFVIGLDEESYPTSRGPTQAKRQVSAGSLFRKVAKEQIGIEIDGVTVTMSRWEAYVRQIYTMALNKNNSAARLLDQLRRQFPSDLPPGDEITIIISEFDAKV